MVIVIFIHIRFKWVEKYYCFLDWISHAARQKINAEATHEIFKFKPPTIFSSFFNFTSNVHNKNHHLSRNSQWTITAAAIHRINHILRYEKNDTWTTHYHIRWLSTIHEYDPRSWRWWYHGKDLTTGQKETVMEKGVYSKTKTRQRVLCFIFDRGCIIICEFLHSLIWGHYLFGGLYYISYLHMFYEQFKRDLYIIA